MFDRDCTGSNCERYRHGDVEIDRPNDKSNYFLIGVESTHDDSTEDRTFKLYYAMSTKYLLKNCTWHPQSNYFETIQVPYTGLQTAWGKKY